MDGNTIQIKCPVCNRRILDAHRDIKTIIAPAADKKKSDYYANAGTAEAS